MQHIYPKKHYTHCIIVICFVLLTIVGKTQNTENLIVKTFSIGSWSNLPVIYSNQVKGGIHQVESISDGLTDNFLLDLDEIPTERLQKGMLVNVLDADGNGSKASFQYIGDGSTNTYPDDWTQIRLLYIWTSGEYYPQGSIIQQNNDYYICNTAHTAAANFDAIETAKWDKIATHKDINTLQDSDQDTKVEVEQSADEDKIRFTTSGSERMIIDNSGKIGIGTSTPTARAEIEGNGETVLKLKQNGSWSGTQWGLYVEGYSYLNGFRVNAADGIRALHKVNAGGQLGFSTQGNDPITFTQSSSTERMRIASGGNVGIGTNAPSTKLDVSGQIRLRGGNPGANKILQSDANGLGSWATISGDATLNGGTLTIGNNKITTAKITDDAITVAKIGTAGAGDTDKVLTTDGSGDPQWEAKSNFASSSLTDGQVLVGNASNMATGVTPSGDVTISNTGVTTIGTAKINSGKIADGQVMTADIANLNVTESKLANNAVTNSRIADNAVTTAKIGTAGAGDANKVLTTTAAGDPQWEAKSALGDDLGNHTATENIKLSGNYLSNDGGNEGIFVATDGKVGVGTNTPAGKMTIKDGGTLLANEAVVSVHGDDGAPFLAKYYNDTYSSTTAVMGYYGKNDGEFIFANLAPKAIHFSNNGYTNRYLTIADGGNIGVGTTTPLAKLHAGTTISDYATLDFSTTGAVITASSGDQVDAESNVLTLMRDGTSSVVYAGAARFDMSQWKANGTNASTKLDIKLANTSTADLNSVLTMQSNGNVGVGTTTPGAKLEVAGQVKITGGTPGANKLLTSDANGLASWVAPAFASSTLTDGQILVGNDLNVATGVTPSGDVTITNSGVTTIGTAKINSGKIADGQVMTADIANLNVTEGKLADNAVTAAKIGTAGAADGDKVLTTTATGDPQWEAKSALADNLGNHTATQNIKLSGNYLSNDGGNEGIFVATDGKVGIGINTPSELLDINGRIRMRPEGSGLRQLTLSNGNGATWSGGLLISSSETTTAALRLFPFGDNIWFQNTNSAGDIYFSATDSGNFTGNVLFKTTGKVGIGTVSPEAKLDINGQIKIRGGVPGANKILTSDANGLASWVTPSFASKTLTDGQILVGNASNVATGLTPSGDVTISNTGVTTIGANKITSGKISDGEVKTSDIANLNVTEGKLATNSVNNSKIADNAVTTAKIGTAGVGDADKVLTTTATGDPQWEAKSALADNLGNHTATENIKLSGNYLSNDGGNEGVFVATNGKVGIGTNTPAASLSIATGGDASLSAHGYLMLGSSTSALNVVYDENEIQARNNGAASKLYLQSEGGDFSVHHNSGSGNRFIIKDNGNVGIGVDDPLEALSVNGNIETDGNYLFVNPGIFDFASLPSPSSSIMGIKGTNHSRLRITSGSSDTFDDSEGASIDLHGNLAANNSGRLDLVAGSAANSGNAITFWANNGVSQSSKMVINSDGKVGIGTTSPTELLDINGKIKLRSQGVGSHQLTLSNGDGSAGSGSLVIGSSQTSNAAFRLLPYGNDIWFQNTNNAGSIHFSGMNAADLTGNILFHTTGNVGIGTTSPGAKLEVAGQVKITGGTPGANKVLTSDANGLATWQNTQGDNLGNHTATQNIKLSGNYLSNDGGNEGIFVSTTGNVGIGTTSTNAPLQFANSTANRKIVLYEKANNDHEFYGLGINSGILRYQTDSPNTSHVFYAATSNTTSNELMRIKGDGNVGIGTATPSTKLDINGQIKIRGGSPGVNKVLSSDANGLATWQNAQVDNLGNHTATQNIKLSGNYLSNDGGNEGIFVSTTGNVGIGNSAPNSPLDVNSSTSSKRVINIRRTDNLNESGIAFQNSGSAYEWSLYNTADTGSAFRIAGGNAEANVDDLTSHLTILNGGNIGIGTTSPGAKLEIAGQVKITGGIPGANKLLTSDANGLASWLAPSFASSTLTNGQILVGNASNIATGVTPTGDVNFSNTGVTTIGASKITSGKITDGEVKTADIANLNVTNGKIADNAVTTAKIGTTGAADGDKVLTTTAAGDPQWENKSALADNLGNHTASQNIKLSGNYLSNDGGNEGIFVATDGKVGIGTNAPHSLVQITGSTAGGGSGNGSILYLKQNTTWTAANQWALYVDGYTNLGGYRINGSDGQRGIYLDNTTGQLGFATRGDMPITFTQSNTAERMRIEPGGNVGIGTTNPDTKLDVNGQIKIRGGAPGANKLLTSDANGLASWVAPAFASSTLTNGQILIGNGTNVATGVTPSGDVNFSNTGVTTIGASKITSGKITDGEVKTADIANLNVTEGKLAANAVTKGKIADNAVTTAKIGTAGAADGDKVLTTTAAGDPQWENRSALADNLGNHTASQNIKLSGNYLSNDGGNEGIFVDTDGKIGIGTNTPERELHLNDGVFRMDRTSNSGSFFFHRKQTDGTALKTFLFGMDANGVNNGSFFIADNGTAIGGASTKRLLIDNSGNVGIGTITPGTKLEVAGQVKITGGSPGTNKILQSDANGVGSWVDLSGDAILSGGTLTVGNSKITNTKIADNAITAAKIGTAGVGDANKVLTTTSAGDPQWEAKTALGDNLGNHTATQDINLSTHKIMGSGTNKPFELSEAYIRFAENLNTDAQIRSYADLILWANDDNGGTEHMIFKVGGTGAGTERMRLTSSGNLGIGTTSVNDKLVVRDGTGEIRFGGGNGRTISAYENGSTLSNFDFHAVQTYFNSDFLIAPNKKISTSNGSTDNLYLTTSNSSKAIYIDRKVGIGTNAPSNQLHVNAASDPIRAQGLQSASDNEIVTVDANGVFHKKAANISGISTQNADYTATANDETLLADASTANMTITLPAASGNTGLKITIKRIDTSSHTLTISGNTATIDGQASVSMNVAWQAYTFQCDGTNWYIIGRY